MTKTPDKQKINQALVLWERNKDINEFIKEKLGLPDEEGKAPIDRIIDNAVSHAQLEESPVWTQLLFNQIAPKKSGEGNNGDININIGNFIDNLKE